MNGSQTTGANILAEAIGGAAGANSDVIGAGATIAEALKDDELRHRD